MKLQNKLRKVNNKSKIVKLMKNLNKKIIYQKSRNNFNRKTKTIQKNKVFKVYKIEMITYKIQNNKIFQKYNKSQNL